MSELPTRSVSCLILVTGSRAFTDRLVIRRTFLGQLATWDVLPAEVGLITGGADGADTIADEEGRALGLWVAKPMLPDWPVCAPNCRSGHRRARWDGSEYCPTAGHRRNQAMVDRVVRFLAGAPGRRAVCCVFRVEGKSSGTDDCVDRTSAAGIPLVRGLAVVRR